MTPSEISDLLSPKLDSPPKLDGPKGGDGLNDVGGEGKRLVAPAPIGEGNTGARDDVGELSAEGLDGRDGPAADNGDC